MFLGLAVLFILVQSKGCLSETPFFTLLEYVPLRSNLCLLNDFTLMDTNVRRFIEFKLGIKNQALYDLRHTSYCRIICMYDVCT